MVGEIEQRLRELVAVRNTHAATVLSLERQLSDARRDLAACDGAIQDCDYWLARAREKAPKE